MFENKFRRVCIYRNGLVRARGCAWMYERQGGIHRPTLPPVRPHPRQAAYCCCSCVEFQSRYLATPATRVLSSNTFEPPFRISACLDAIYSVGIPLSALASRSTHRVGIARNSRTSPPGGDEGIWKVAKRVGCRGMNGWG